jgi:hypothetical protein
MFTHTSRRLFHRKPRPLFLQTVPVVVQRQPLLFCGRIRKTSKTVLFRATHFFQKESKLLLHKYRTLVEKDYPIIFRIIIYHSPP